jgi:hypothetical protein
VFAKQTQNLKFFSSSFVPAQGQGFASFGILRRYTSSMASPTATTTTSNPKGAFKSIIKRKNKMATVSRETQSLALEEQLGN